jgi:hypothetical protein
MIKYPKNWSDDSKTIIVNVDDITKGLKKNSKSQRKISLKKQIWTKVEEPLDVKVIIPYVKQTPLLQTVVDSLRVQYVQPEVHKVSGKEGYWKLLNKTWKEGQEFFIVEHDIIAWPGAINEMKNCEGVWCTLPSLCHGKILGTTFGCVKFGQKLIDAEPDMWENIGKTLNGKVWFRQDANFVGAMAQLQYNISVHFPAATHLNEIQWPDAISKRGAYKKVVWQNIEQNGKNIGITLTPSNFLENDVIN